MSKYNYDVANPAGTNELWICIFENGQEIARVQIHPETKLVINNQFAFENFLKDPGIK